MDMSGHQKDATLQGVLTSWGLKREGPVGERERVRLTEGHSLLEAREEARPERRRDVATQGKTNVARGANAWKERERARGTYYLKTPERGTHQDTERE